MWYCNQAYGTNKVTSTVKEICKDAGFDGKYTNHSLHATSASRIFESEVPEQVIKEITGCRSDCVRLYKRTSDDIKMKASATICGSHSKETEGKMSEESSKNECDGETKSESIDSITGPKEKKRLEESLTACEMIKNVIKSKMEIKKKTQRCVHLVKKVAKKLVQKHKKNAASKLSENKIVIDLNVNLNMNK